MSNKLVNIYAKGKIESVVCKLDTKTAQELRKDKTLEIAFLGGLKGHVEDGLIYVEAPQVVFYTDAQAESGTIPNGEIKQRLKGTQFDALVENGEITITTPKVEDVVYKLILDNNEIKSYPLVAGKGLAYYTEDKRDI